jgi:hypothetical protein
MIGAQLKAERQRFESVIDSFLLAYIHVARITFVSWSARILA